ncbi:MAG: FtsX-like permease family protein [Actinomycetota bacterium]|nr:FtsX-like permease family protein [Actinomycetota bacterium]
MFKLSLRNIWSRKGRLVLTALAVIAGTAFLSGVFVFTDTIKNSFNSMFATAYENTDAFVRSTNVIEGDFGQETRDRIPVEVADQVAALPGVSEAHGDVTGNAVVSFNGKVLGQDGPPKFGSSWSPSEASPFQIAEGRAPVGPAEVVLDKGSAKSGKVKVGDTVSITTIGAARDFTVVGLATFAGADSPGGSGWALFELPTAQEFVIGDTEHIDAVIVRGDGTMSERELADSIQAAIGDPEIETLTGGEIIAEAQDAVASTLSIITVFLTVFALISLFVGSFIIYNVFSISAAQRTQENALLRAIGASRAQVIRSMFEEALVVGVVGTLIGCVSGIGLAGLILWILNATGFGPGDTSLTLNSTGFIITLIVGTVVTLVCAVAPAIRSGRVPPLAAMRDVAVDRAGVSTTRKVLGGVSIVVSVVSVKLGLGGSAIWLGVAAATIYLALIALGPFVASPVARLTAPVLGRLRGASGTMAGRNAARNPKRTALTAGALAVGLSLMIGVATLGASLKGSTREIFSEAFENDYVISPEQADSGIGIPATVAEDVKAAGVGDAMGVAGALLRLKENGEYKAKGALAVVPADAQAVVDFTFTEGGFDQLGPDGILFSVDKAARDDLGVGDEVSVQLLDGTELQLTIRGLFEDDLFGNLIVDRSIFDGQKVPLSDFSVYIRADGGVTEANTTALEGVMESYPTAKLQDRDEYIDEQSKQVDEILNFIYALLGMSIFIAAIGIVITLWLSVWERRRELGLLRAVGTTRRQVRSSVLWESMVTGVVGVIMGVVVGLTLGWIIVKSFEDDGLSVFSLPVGTVVVATIGSLFLAGLAAIIPARKAAKSDILSAIATT